MKRLAGLLALGLAGFASPAVAGEAKPGAWRPVGCESLGVSRAPKESRCGFVTVPRRRSEPSGATIELAALVLPAPRGEGKSPVPLFLAQGGPGGATIGTFAQLLVDDPSYRPARDRDLVLWDQRGTGRSKPYLGCPEVVEAGLKASLVDAPEGEGSDEERALSACGARLSQEAGDLSDFNTVENANDVEAIREALGYDRIAFYGVSYGTELGQYLLRQHPEHLSGVVLDAVVPTSFNLVTEVALVKQRIGEKYFEGCAQEEACGRAFPALGARFLKLIDRLDATPAVVEVDDPRKRAGGAGKPLRVKLTGSTLSGLLYSALYDRSMHAVLPLLVDRADKGDLSYVANALLPRALFGESVALGMHLAVECAARGDSDPGGVSYAGIERRLAEAERRGAETMLKACREWKIALLPREVLLPVKSDVPVLLLSGAFDPITPPSFAARVAETLPRARSVVFPAGSHGQAFLDPCANSLIQAFVARPGADLDASCADRPSGRFLVPRDLLVLPALRESFGGKPGEAGPALVGLLARSASLFAGILLLATALVVYPLARLLRGRRAEEEDPGFAGALSRWAPRLAVLELVCLVAFLLALVRALTASMAASPALLALGALLADQERIFVIPFVATFLAALMVAAAVAIWVRRQRTLAGRLYFTLLAAAGLACVKALSDLGLLAPWMAS